MTLVLICIIQDDSKKALAKMPHRPEVPHFVRQVRSVFHFCYAFLHCFCLYKCLPKSFFLYLLCFANFLRYVSKPSVYNQVLFYKTCEKGALAKMPHRPEAPHFVRQVRSVFHFATPFCTVFFILYWLFLGVFRYRI